MTVNLVDLTLTIFDRAPTFRFDPKWGQSSSISVLMIFTTIFTSFYLARMSRPTWTPPDHFYEDGLTLDKIDLRRCFGPAVVVDLTGKAPKEEIDPSDLEPYAAEVGAVAPSHSPHGLGTGTSQAKIDSTDEPVVTEEACAWMIDKGVVCLAMDMPTTYPGKRPWRHIFFLCRGPALRWLSWRASAGIERLEPTVVVLIALPLSIRDCDGSPCRVVALDGDPDSLMHSWNGLQFVP